MVPEVIVPFEPVAEFTMNWFVLAVATKVFVLTTKFWTSTVLLQVKNEPADANITELQVLQISPHIVPNINEFLELHMLVIQLEIIKLFVESLIIIRCSDKAPGGCPELAIMADAVADSGLVLLDEMVVKAFILEQLKVPVQLLSPDIIVVSWALVNNALHILFVQPEIIVELLTVIPRKLVSILACILLLSEPIIVDV